MSFDIKKFIGGFNIFKGEQFGKILFYAVIVAIGLAVYHQITRPTSSQRIIVQKGGTATIQQQTQTERRWIISGSVQNDKTFGIGLGYMF